MGGVLDETTELTRVSFTNMKSIENFLKSMTHPFLYIINKYNNVLLKYIIINSLSKLNFTIFFIISFKFYI
jgi:MinD superfamily P-loop ATPase